MTCFSGNRCNTDVRIRHEQTDKGMAKHVWVNILETGFLCYTLYQRIVTIRVARPTEIVNDDKRLVSQAQIGDTLRRVGLNPSDKRPFRKYSLGMKQRLGIAAAIVESPDLILLDEPFNALDESGIKEIRDLLRELRQKGKLIVLTCHDRQQMESLADEIIAMREGRIVNVDKNCHEEV